MLLARASGLEGFARHVVIKRIRPELTHEERFVAAFVEEARIAASLHHQHIVQVHDIGDEGGAIYFAMEYVHGEDVRKLLNRVRDREELVPLQHVLSIVMATAAGLHYAHEQVKASGESKGIVHRDVSPANILIGYDGSVKLVDFGLANAVQRSTTTASGTLKAKASYMSPEQCTGKPLDRRTDTFSLGVVLFELLTAQRLFKGANEFMTMAAIVDGEIPRPSTLRPDVPPALDEIVMRALSRAPESRYQTAESMRESLEAFALAAELRMSHKALADYLVSLFGERPEPWLEDAAQQPAFTHDESTHAGVVGKPRNPKDLVARFSTEVESPLAQSAATTDWGDEDEHEATAGQLPSLKRLGASTEPTKTLRKAPAAEVNVNVNVRPRASEPAKAGAGVMTPTSPAEKFDDSAGTLPTEPGKKHGPSPSALQKQPAGEVTVVLPAPDKPAVLDSAATAKPPKVEPKKIARGDEEPGGSSTMVEPPIFDGGLREEDPDDIDDDGLDEDEPATEIAMTVPEHKPEPVKEKIPLALRRPPPNNELQRSSEQVPAPLRPANRITYPHVQAITPQPRDITPPGSPPMPMSYQATPARLAPDGSFAGVDPAAVAAGFQQPMIARASVDPTFQGLPTAEPTGERISGLSAGRRPLVIIGVVVAVVVAGLLAIRACDSDKRSAPAVTPADAELQADDDDSSATTPVDAGVRTSSVRDAGVRDAGTGSATSTPKRPVRRPPPKRPKK